MSDSLGNIDQHPWGTHPWESCPRLAGVHARRTHRQQLLMRTLSPERLKLFAMMNADRALSFTEEHDVVPVFDRGAAPRSVEVPSGRKSAFAGEILTCTIPASAPY